MRHGGKILIDQLAVQGCGTVFCVPGESFLAALDGLYDQEAIATIVCRHESGAAIMAEATGKLTGKPGVAFVTRGPGATNASAGVHIARQDSTPLILFVGLPRRAFSDRESFQDFDITAFFGSMAKWVGIIPDAERIPEYVSRAYTLALSGRPGPVVLGIAEDMLFERVSVDDAARVRIGEAQVAASDVELIVAAIDRSQQPLMIVGGPGWNKALQAQVEEFSSRFQIPVGTAFRAQGHFDNRHDNYCGHFGVGADVELASRAKRADLLFVMGARLDEITTGAYSNIRVPGGDQFLIHSQSAADEIGRNTRADLPIVASSASLGAALASIGPAAYARPSAPGVHNRGQWCSAARAGYVEHIIPITTPGRVKLEQIIKAASEMLDDDAIICSGAGNYTAWLHRYFEYKEYGTELAPVAGSMGYGVPAAISAKIQHPGRQVVAFAGDGCLMMTVQELATAAQYGLGIILIVINNGQLATIRMHQERHFPDRVIGTQLSNPDFQLLGQSFGAQTERVDETTAFRPALRRAFEHDGLSLIEVIIDPKAISPRSRG